MYQNLVRVLQRNRTSRKWLTWLWRLGSPVFAASNLEIKETWGHSSRLSPKPWETELMMKVPVWVQMWRRNIPAWRLSEREIISYYSTFCSIKAFTKLKADPLWERQSALFSQLIQMLISSKNTTHRHNQNIVYPSIWALCGPVLLAH